MSASTQSSSSTDDSSSDGSEFRSPFEANVMRVLVLRLIAMLLHELFDELESTLDFLELGENPGSREREFAYLRAMRSRRDVRELLEVMIDFSESPSRGPLAQ